MYAVHVREDEVDDERRPSAMVRGSLSRFTIIVQNDILAQSKKKKGEKKKERRGGKCASKPIIFISLQPERPVIERDTTTVAIEKVTKFFDILFI